MFIINAIKKLKNSKRIFFTTPSHSQGAVIPSVIRNLIGLKAFKCDFSEVDGLDNLKAPEKCILKSQIEASKIYNSKYTFYLTNGSSSGILAIMLSLLTPGDKVLIARNAHESIYNGLVITKAVPVWFLPDYNKEFSLFNGVTLEQIKSEYIKNPDIKAIFITSPTYEGMCSEVEKIAKFCKEKNIFFFVDEAHGALFSFSDKLPKRAIDLGADASVQSLHKTAPALTGCALLHIGKNCPISIDTIQKNLNLVTTTSPSWLLIASIEAAINYLSTNKAKYEINNLVENILCFQKECKKFEFLSDKNHDITKMVFKKNGFLGEQISEYLDENNIEDELVTDKSVLCLCGIGTTKKKLKRLFYVLNKFSQKNQEKYQYQNDELFVPKMKFLPHEAHILQCEVISKEKAIGCVIGENITPYPPCIPILVSGEVIEKSHLKYLPDKVKIIKG